MEIESLFCKNVTQIDAYNPPDWEGRAARAGLPMNRIIRLDANENPYGLPARARQALAQFDRYQHYPEYRALTAAVADYAGVRPEQVLLGNGGDEIISLLIRLFVEPGEGAIVCPPTFGMYAVDIRAHAGRVLQVPRRPDFSLDVEGIEAAVLGAAVRGAGGGPRPKLLFLVSPGNPDGQILPLDTIRRLLTLPLAVVVDEAYVEFSDQSVVPLLDEYPNLLILRTFSKWAGMAGLRLGYVLASDTLIDVLRRLRPPYNVNAAASVAALASLEDVDSVKKTIQAIVNERQRLTRMLATLPGVRPLPSQANFVFCWLDEGPDGPELADALVDHGILIRAYGDPALARAVRISVGRPDQHNRLLRAWRTILGLEPAEGTEEPEPLPLGESGRRGACQRRTGETDISVVLDLDGSGQHQVDTGVGFLDHMLAQIAAHGLLDLDVRARGDLGVDEHHTVEDVAIGLGRALDQALGDRQGLVRMGQALAPLDEALAQVVVDLSGRPYAVIDAAFDSPRLGAMDSDLVIHFFETLAVHARLSLHARVLYGRNDHHKAEALFKALGRALDAATRIDPRRQGVPSTKGVL